MTKQFNRASCLVSRDKEYYCFFYTDSDFLNFQCVGLADGGVGAGARADGALLGLVVDMDEAEAEPVALVPLEIVEE